jgi:hypothetical protein
MAAMSIHEWTIIGVVLANIKAFGVNSGSFRESFEVFDLRQVTA